MRELWYAHTGRKGPPPKVPEPPVGWLTEQAQEATKAASWQAKAEAWRAANKDKYAEMERRLALQNPPE